jgi:acyl carrier protein
MTPAGSGAPAQMGPPFSEFLGYMSDKASPLRQPAPPADNAALQREVADLIVAALNLDVAAADIDPQAPLYGEGLGLDSIDILEIALVVSKQYGIQLRADSEENEQIFRSLRYLADYIAAHRTK